MGLNIRYRFAVALLASSISLSCGSTQLSHTWRGASYTTGPLKKMLVVAVRKDQLRRHAWEDGFAAALSRHGVDATPSYQLIATILPDTALIDSVAKQGNFDGIMLAGRASDKITEGVTASSEITPPDSPSQQLGGSSSEYYNHEYYPGYPLINETVKDEIKIWAIRGRARMIWSGVGEVHEDGQDVDVSSEIISLIVKELVKQEVIAAGI